MSFGGMPRDSSGAITCGRDNMTRKYKRKSQKCNWSPEQLRAAIDAIRDGRAIREVGRAFGIPESTLRDRLKSNNSDAAKLGRNPVFNKAQEEALSTHVQKLAKVFFGITPIELRRLAYSFAEENNIKHPFDSEKKLAGEDWLTLF
ncbi:hypothetical protein PPYR_04551 [Photinus pyralis]|uniref:HTH psq-type domain-containing protein n=2 Tax=Photinus pyralis TaxID=7054 RepID=A0A5N4AYD1_PHOPY|nr:hypothetical protein PPYR_04551 [Photinus pyralis]